MSNENLNDSIIENAEISIETNPSEIPANISRPEYIPEKFWNPQNNQIRVEEMAKSYSELEKQFSKKSSQSDEIAKLNNELHQARAELAQQNLVFEMGGAEKWQELQPQLQEFATENFGTEIWGQVANNPEQLKKLHNLMTASLQVQQQKTNATQLPKIISNPQNSQSPEHSLRQIMRHPDYWKKGNPQLLKQVADGFANLYGN